MYTTYVTICGPHGIYPDFTLLAGRIGQASCEGLPLSLYTPDDSDFGQSGLWLQMQMFWASFQITHKETPAFAFLAEQGVATLVFKGSSKPNLSTILSRAKRILRGGNTVPIHHQVGSFPSWESPEAIRQINEMNEQQEYMHIHNRVVSTLDSHIARWVDNSELSWHKPAASTVRKYFSLFSGSSRFIQIALHYYLHACNLIHLRFIEEAGLNLQLTVDAILHDFMVCHSIGDKPKAIASLRKVVTLPLFHMEFLEDLYEARNNFLAHIDTEMFTEHENINDPDAYCYEHYESVCWLITRYIKYKKKRQQQ